MTITEQEFFDHACYRFRDGTGRAVHTDHRGRRRYAFAGDDGLRSPVGALIPTWHPALFSRRIFYAMAFIHNDLAGVAWPDTGNGLHLAAAVEAVHDDPACWDWARFIGEPQLAAIARRYDLTYATPARPAETTTTNEGARQ